MEDISNSRKRKHEDGGEFPKDRRSKHTKHIGNHDRVQDSTAGKDTTSSPTSFKNGQQSSNERISNLKSSLAELLEQESKADLIHILGDEAFSQISSLHKSLQHQNSSSNGSSAAQNKPSEVRNLPKSLSPISLSPWTSSAIPKSLPPLPEVFDPTLEAGAFIHHGTTGGSAKDLSYEKLEWVGDAYLYITATLLISQTFPVLLPGKCSQLRERLVKNVQLSSYAKEYGFEKRAVLPSMHGPKDSDRTKILGDIFEAYVAAVILSDPTNGVSRCSEWLKALWGMTLEKEIRAQEQQAPVDSPLWRLRGTAEPVQLTAPKSELSTQQDKPAKERLKMLIGAKGVVLNYKDVGTERKDKSNKLPVFSVGLYLDGWGEKDKQLGFGSAHGKKEAGQKAAEMAMKNTKLMNIYVEKKRLFDAQRELEKQALESLS